MCTRKGYAIVAVWTPHLQGICIMSTLRTLQLIGILAMPPTHIVVLQSAIHVCIVLVMVFCHAAGFGVAIQLPMQATPALVRLQSCLQQK
jgi:hypothetical protein